MAPRSHTHAPFGNAVIGAEPAWYRGVPTPYYDASHVAYRAKVRDFVERELRPNVDDYIERGQYDMSLHKRAHELGISTILYPDEFGGRRASTTSSTA